MIRTFAGDQVPDGLDSPDVYFLPGYGRAASTGSGGQWVLLEGFDGAWQMPLILRTLQDGAVDAISPYGYAGVYASPSLSPAQVQQAWSATVDHLRELGVISLLLRHSPLVHQAQDLPGLQSIISGHPTIVLEPLDSDHAWTAMESSCRNQVRKAAKSGYTCDVRKATHESLATGSAFRGLYEGTMRRRDAAPSFFFGDSYYHELVDALGSNLLMAEVQDDTGVAVSSTLLMRHGQRLHYHLTGSSVSHTHLGSNNLMMWSSTEFATTQGLNQFHLGGGLSPRDGLFRFKRSFGGRELKYDVSGLIVDHEAYKSRTEIRAKECDVAPEELCAATFFPAYRGGPSATC